MFSTRASNCRKYRCARHPDFRLQRLACLMGLGCKVSLDVRSHIELNAVCYQSLENTEPPYPCTSMSRPPDSCGAILVALWVAQRKVDGLTAESKRRTRDDNTASSHPQWYAWLHNAFCQNRSHMGIRTQSRPCRLPTRCDS